MKATDIILIAQTSIFDKKDSERFLSYIEILFPKYVYKDKPFSQILKELGLPSIHTLSTLEAMINLEWMLK